jgi:ABC-type phosphate transport system substrate-binding protein
LSKLSKKIIIVLAVMAMMATYTVMGIITPGELQIHGSSTVYPITTTNAQADFIGTWQTDITNFVTSQFGSGDGYEQVSLTVGTADIGAHSREPKSGTSAGKWEDPGCADIRLWCIGLDSIAIILNPDNPIAQAISTGDLPGLTGQQVTDIYCLEDDEGSPGTYMTLDADQSGTVTWAEVGTALGLPGDPRFTSDTVQVVRRPLNSGTHDCFNKFFCDAYGKDTIEDGYIDPNSLEIHANSVLLDWFAGEGSTNPEYGIGYIGLGFVGDPGGPYVPPLDVEGTGAYVIPTKLGALDGTYPPLRYLYYSTIGVPAKTITVGPPTANVPGKNEAQFISYIMASGDPFVSITPHNYVLDEGYINKWRADFVGRACADTLAPIHPSLPDNLVTFDDIVYFVSQIWADWDACTGINPYGDFDADSDIDFDDIVSFIKAYDRWSQTQLGNVQGPP